MGPRRPREPVLRSRARAFEPAMTSQLSTPTVTLATSLVPSAEPRAFSAAPAPKSAPSAPMPATIGRARAALAKRHAQGRARGPPVLAGVVANSRPTFAMPGQLQVPCRVARRQHSWALPRHRAAGCRARLLASLRRGCPPEQAAGTTAAPGRPSPKKLGGRQQRGTRNEASGISTTRIELRGPGVLPCPPAHRLVSIQ